jgi:hypothetical protein
MKHDLFVLVGLVLLAYWVIRPAEKFFDNRLYPKEPEVVSHGSRTDTSTMKDTTNMGIVNDEINNLVQLIQKHYLSAHKVCIYIINTNDITRYEGANGTLYKCSFMCSVLGGDFPYGLGIYVEVLNGKITYMTGQQPREVFAEIEDQGNFTPFQSVVDFSNQSLLLNK